MDPAGQADPATGSPAQPNGAARAPGTKRAESVTHGGVRVTRTEEPFRAELASALHPAFLVAAGCCALALVLVAVGLPEERLRRAVEEPEPA